MTDPARVYWGDSLDKFTFYHPVDAHCNHASLKSEILFLSSMSYHLNSLIVVFTWAWSEDQVTCLKVAMTTYLEAKHRATKHDTMFYWRTWHVFNNPGLS